MPQLKTIDQFCDDNPAFTPSAVRHLIFKHAPRDQYNSYSDHALQRAVIRTGRRVRIDERAFLEGLTELSENRPSS